MTNNTTPAPIKTALYRLAAADASASPLLALNDLAAAQRATQEAIRDHVSACRARGESWATIGSALGISKQAAQQRFGTDSDM